MIPAVQGAAVVAAHARPAPLFEMRGVGKRLGAFDALAEVDAAFTPREIHCLLGKNGAGKSTLCNLIFGIHQPTSGEMLLNGASHAPSGPRDALTHGVAMVHQHFSLAEDLAVIATCRRVADTGAAVVLVTHKLAEIRSAADRATVLAGGRAVATSDRPGEEIDRLVAAMIRRDVKSLDGAMMSALGMAEAAPLAAPARLRHPGGEAMQADGLSFRDASGALRLDNATFTVDRGEIVGIAGVEGNGQSELGMILAGLARPIGGRWFANGRDLTRATPRAITEAGVGIVPEDCHSVACAPR